MPPLRILVTTAVSRISPCVITAQLLKRFRLTEGGYRKQFKTGKLEPGETPAQSAERLKRYLEKWREMAGFEPTYEGIQEMILRDQYFLTCDKSSDITGILAQMIDDPCL